MQVAKPAVGVERLESVCYGNVPKQLIPHVWTRVDSNELDITNSLGFIDYSKHNSIVMATSVTITIELRTPSSHIPHMGCVVVYAPSPPARRALRRVMIPAMLSLN